MCEFVQTRTDLQTQITFDYLYECEDVAVSSTLYLVASYSYVVVFMLVLAVNTIDSCSMEVRTGRSSEEEAHSRYIKSCMAKMMLSLLFLTSF